jgi:hypothetical protein
LDGFRGYPHLKDGLPSPFWGEYQCGGREHKGQ